MNVWTCSHCGETVTSLDYDHYLATIRWHTGHCAKGEQP